MKIKGNEQKDYVQARDTAEPWIRSVTIHSKEQDMGHEDETGSRYIKRKCRRSENNPVL